MGLRLNIGNSGIGNLKEVSWYSRSTDNILGAKWKTCKVGSWVFRNNLKIVTFIVFLYLQQKLIEEYLMDIFYSRVKPGQGRNIKGYTVNMGMIQFHRGYSGLAEQIWIYQKRRSIYTNKVQSPYHTNALEAGLTSTPSIIIWLMVVLLNLSIILCMMIGVSTLRLILLLDSQ